MNAVEARNRAIYLLNKHYGLTAIDLEGIETGDFEPNTGNLHLSGIYRTYQKTARTITVEGETLEAMRAYSQARGDALPVAFFVQAAAGGASLVYFPARCVKYVPMRYMAFGSILHTLKRRYA